MKPRNEIEKIVAEWSKKYGGNAKSIIEDLRERIRAGESVEKAVKNSLKGMPKTLQAMMAEAIAAGAFTASGAKLSSSALNRLNAISWSSDGFNLSQRLHKLDSEMYSAIVSVLSDSIKRGTTVTALARKLLDGYGNAKDYTGIGEIPDYLNKLLGATRRMQIYSSPKDIKEYMASIRRTRRMVESMRSQTALRSAYEQLLLGAERLNQKALNKAIEIAIAEKSRYLAERIARTETARAWSDGFYARYMDDPDVIAFQWRLSSAHRIIDICDFYANADLFGLGAGIYPKDKMPPHPAHPHCTCLIEPVFLGQIDTNNYTEKMDEKAVTEYFGNLSSSDLASLLGKNGVQAWSNTGNWSNYLRGWNGLERPESRLKKVR